VRPARFDCQFHWIRWPSRARARASSAPRQLIIDMRGVLAISTMKPAAGDVHRP
jgi:hypothetical protein